MNELDQRFDEAIKELQFDVIEMKGLSARPLLALKAGMALGYKMALDDYSRKLKEFSPQ